MRLEPVSGTIIATRKDLSLNGANLDFFEVHGEITRLG